MPYAIEKSLLIGIDKQLKRIRCHFIEPDSDHFANMAFNALSYQLNLNSGQYMTQKKDRNRLIALNLKIFLIQLRQKMFDQLDNFLDYES